MEYPFNPGDIVENINTRRKGVVRSVGKMGDEVTALVTDIETGESGHFVLRSLKKTLRAIDGGKE